MLAITAGATVLTGIGLSSISVLFPELRRAFPDASNATLSWVANVFTIVGAATLIPAGAIADRTGKKRMVLLGVALFVGGSVLGAVAWSPGVLIAARIIQSLGASCYTPASAALLMSAYPPERLASAIGVWSVCGGISSAFGPPLAGLLVQLSGWRATMWFNVPVGIAIFALGSIYITETDRDESRSIPDLLGTLLVSAAISPIVYALVQSKSWGWFDERTIGWLGAGLVVALVFVWRCARHHNPLLDLSLLRISMVRVANLGTFVMAIAWFCVYFALTQYITTYWEWSAMKAGIVTAPVSLGAAALGFTVGRLAPRYGHKRFILAGAASFIALALIGRVLITETPSVWRVVVLCAAMGCASGSAFPSFIALSVFDVEPSDRAVVSGINFMSQRIGTTVGTSFAIAFVTAKVGGGIAGFRQSLAVTAAGAACALVIGLRVRNTSQPV